MESEGPASHRKKDLLDKATKEAEHREKLQDLLTRLSSLNEKVSNEESSLARLKDKIADANKELEGVRGQLKGHSTRRANLDLAGSSLNLAGQALMLKNESLSDEEAEKENVKFQAQRFEALFNKCVVSISLFLLLPFSLRILSFDLTLTPDTDPCH